MPNASSTFDEQMKEAAHLLWQAMAQRADGKKSACQTLVNAAKTIVDAQKTILDAADDTTLI